MKLMRWSLAIPLALALLVGCSDSSNAPTPEHPVDLATLQLASCVPESAATVTAVIGKDGGSISVGHHTLVVPRRSLKDDVAITMQITGDSLSDVVFLPEGLKFKKSKPAMLTLSYDGCSFGAPAPSRSSHGNDDDDNSGHGNHHAPETTGVVYLSSASQILEFRPSTIDSTAMTVTAELEHFSRYAVAW